MKTVSLHYSTTAGALTSVPMNPVGNDLYAGVIPAQPAKTLVVYYVEAVDNDYESARWPIEVRDRRYFTGYTPPLDLVINEITVQNDDQHVDPDEPLETPDWIELYNKGATTIRLDGLSLTDDNDLTRRFEIPAGLTLGPGKRMMFLADDDVGQNLIRGNKPPLHLPFNLNKSDAYVGLYGGMGAVQIDDKNIKDPPPFGAVGRYPDGAEWSTKLTSPAPVCQTFNAANLLCAHTVDLPRVQK
ncbi:MAG: lamin tail domain-containing protein [Anaerolineales bacterium]|nr:lamin tail domain-containing protein [Anaerolineales bacterium]